MLVGRIVVDDDMDHLLLRHPGIDDIEEADELLMAMTLHALADDLALKDIERREQGGDAVPLIIVGHGAGASLLHRQPRLGAVQRLNLALLIDGQHNGVVRRIDVKSDDVLELGGKLRVAGQLELAHQMRPKTVGTPDPLHRTDADPGRLGHGRAGPMAGRRRRFGQASWPPHVRPLQGSAAGCAMVAFYRAKAPPPFSRNRSCQRQITVLALPVACMISAVP